MIQADQWAYEIVENYRDAFQEEAFALRFSDILGKYDYILGDWGYGQLRLKGFFQDGSGRATYDTKISTVQDYLYEYCNFGCPYFLLKKTGTARRPQQRQAADDKAAPAASVSDDALLGQSQL